MIKRQLFPLGKAYGEAFCNREEETIKLLGNIQYVKHTLIIAPRRYGKSSLAERAILRSKLPSIKINFHLCTSEQEIAQLILDNINKLIGNSIGSVEKLMSSIRKYLSNLEPLLSFGSEYASLKLVPKNQQNYSVIIVEALLLLEKLLVEKNKKAVIFFDEFQEIDKISKHKGIEGAIRTAAQEMQNLSLIFSGSVRALLLSMFEAENRPLYKLCRKIKLDRISTYDYEKHIQKIAVNTWNQQLEQEVFDKIMECSNRHPYYVNYLCDILWESCNQPPNIKDVAAAWKEVIAEEWSDILRELEDLPIGQRRLLKYIANNFVKHIQSQETSTALSMPVSSLSSALFVLIEKDYVEQQVDGIYKVINPILAAVLSGAEA